MAEPSIRGELISAICTAAAVALHFCRQTSTGHLDRCDHAVMLLADKVFSM
jgi:hypothetical protein